MSADKKQVIYDIVERNFICFDPNLTFDQNGVDSMCRINIMLDIHQELGVDLLAMTSDPKQHIPDTLEELECIVLGKLMEQNT